MPRDDLIFIAVVLDRSGSMESLRDDAVGGFNSFLQEQKDAPGSAMFTLAQFDHEYIVVHDGVPIEDVSPLDRNTFVPRGGTALLDAIGRTVNVMEAKIGKMPDDEKPSRMIVATLSDGQENQSQEFTKSAIEKVIKERSGSGWDFVFLSAGLDQFADAAEIGVSANLYAAGVQGSAGMKGVIGGVGKQIANYRSSRDSGAVAVNCSLDSYEREEKTSGGVSLQSLVREATEQAEQDAENGTTTSSDNFVVSSGTDASSPEGSDEK